MPIYMKIEGIVGDVTTKPYGGWVELESAQLGLNRHVTSPTGKGVNREAASPSVSEIVVTKNVDKASAELFKLSLWGEGKKVTIAFVKVNEKAESENYLKLELENALISSYSTSGAGGSGNAKPLESISFNFTKITYSSTSYDADSRHVKPDRPAWEVAKK